MLNPTLIPFDQTDHSRPGFWTRLLNADELRGCDDLEKLIVGCELIAALDGVELLAA